MRPQLSNHIANNLPPVLMTVQRLSLEIAACICIKDCREVETRIEQEREKYGNEFQCYDRLTDLLARKVISLEWDKLLLTELDYSHLN